MPHPRLALAFALALAACAATAVAEPLDADRHYAGTWLEVARTPMWITDGCVAGTTTYTRLDAQRVQVVDDCRKGGVDGKRKAITGRGVIVDAGTDHLLKVNYAPFVTWRYRVFEHDPAGQWFIAGDPKLKRMFVFTREPPSEALLANLVARARRTGYAGELETPPTR